MKLNLICSLFIFIFLLPACGVKGGQILTRPISFTLTGISHGTYTTLTWPAVSGAKNYLVKRGLSSGNYTTLLSTQTELSYTDAGLVSGTTYYYNVTAVGISANSNALSEVAITAGNYFNSNWVDSAGDIFIADSSNNAVEMVPANSGTYFGIAMTAAQIYTIANGLNNPVSVSTDVAGNVYVADLGNKVFRKIAASTGAISIIAGSLTASSWDGTTQSATNVGLNSAYASVVDAYGNLYLSGLGYIAKVDHSTNNISLIAGNQTLSSNPISLTSLCWSSGLTISAAGDIYFADKCTTSNGIFKISADLSTITQVAGSSTSGWLYTGDRAAANLAAMHGPTGLSIDENGVITLVDDGNNAIRKVVSANISTYASQNGLDSTSAAISVTATNMNNPNSVAVDTAGNIYVVETGASCIEKISSGGTVTAVVGTCGTPGSGTPSANGTAATSALLNAPFNLYNSLIQLFI